MNCENCQFQNIKDALNCAKCGMNLYKSKIRVIHDNGKNETYYLFSQNYKIGRSVDNDIVLEDTSVSRYHAEIQYKEGAFTIEDKDSKNGSFFNNLQFKNKVLSNNDCIQLGDITLHYYDGSPLTKTSPSIDTIEFVQNEYFKLAENQQEITIDDALNTTVELAISLVHADKAIILLGNNDRGFSLKIAKNYATDKESVDRLLRKERPFINKAIKRRDIYIEFEPATNDTTGNNQSRKPTIWRRIVLPLMVSKTAKGQGNGAANSEILGVCLIKHNKNFHPISKQKRDLLKVLFQQSSIAIENEILQDETHRNQKLNQQLVLARDIQQKLLPSPSTKIKDFKIVSFIEPCETISGDYFDFIPIAENKVAFAIGDICGKGVPAALLSSTAQAAIRSQLEYSTSPLQIIQNLNRLLIQSTDKSIFLTLFFGILDLKTNQFKYINAGHPPPLLIAKKHTIKQLGGTIPPLGILEENFDAERTTEFSSGDFLLMYTDGLIESHNPQKEIYGRQKFMKSIESIFSQKKSRLVTIDNVIKTIKKDLLTFRDDAKQTDDLTVLAIARD